MKGGETSLTKSLCWIAKDKPQCPRVPRLVLRGATILGQHIWGWGSTSGDGAAVWGAQGPRGAANPLAVPMVFAGQSCLHTGRDPSWRSSPLSMFTAVFNREGCADENPKGNVFPKK